MAFISITRLHIRSWRFYPAFILYSLRSARQAKRSRGFRAGMTATDTLGGAWTITAWDDEAAMRAFRNSGAHLRAMPRLLRWADEASFAHFHAELPELPTLADAHERLQSTGRISKVDYPSSAHIAGRTAPDDVPRLGPTLRPPAR
jgi:hypothetical protein